MNTFHALELIGLQNAYDMAMKMLVQCVRDNRDFTCSSNANAIHICFPTIFK